MWAKLVTLDTIHWYHDGPESIETNRRYDNQACRHKSNAFFLPNSFFSSIQNWKKARGGLLLSSRRLQGRKREWVRPTRQ